MPIPFNMPRPNMDRFTFLSRSSANPETDASGAIIDDDRTPLSPRPVHDIDLDLDVEAQRPATGPHVTEMAERERGGPGMRFMPRFRPAIPSWFSVVSSRRGGDGVSSVNSTPYIGNGRMPRPPSSHYTEGRHGPADNMAMGTDEEIESPKTPRFRIAEQDLPSTRLHLPNLTRTWTQGSNGPPSRPGSGELRSAAVVTEPVPVLPAQHVQTFGVGEQTQPRGFRGADPAEDQLAELAEDGRRRRRHRRDGSDRSNRSRGTGGEQPARGAGADEQERRRRRRRRDRDRRERQGSHGSASGSGSGSGSGRRRERGPPPKHFLFCFPWIKSRRIRNQILRCFVSGMFLILLLTVYLALSVTRNINNSEFTVLLILIILFVTIFFCHGLIRLCMLIVKSQRNGGLGDEDGNTGRRGRLPQMYGPGGYAIPRQPIRVVLARDEEAAGIESETTKINPPAYGLWRESVRVDPNRIYWARNDEATPEVEEMPGEPAHTASRGGVRRPPSYASDDGVTYVVEAQPRSIAPTTDVPTASSTTMHPSEAGRAGHPAEW